MKKFSTFRQAIADAGLCLRDLSHFVHSDRWQGMNIKSKPEMAMYEVLNYSFQAPMATRDLDVFRDQIEPNLPWADRHFEEERVSGHPINPGETWKIWPWSHSADKFRTEGEQFNHSYAERYWPKYAGIYPGGRLPESVSEYPRQGIRYRYADLNDLIDHLVGDPLSRQAYLPVWFPEDGSHNDRKPCTIGYHFIQRAGYLHIVYQLRSCDYFRHFRDDIYLTVRLLLWVLDRLGERDEAWKSVIPGIYTMHITSLHLFKNDYRQLFGKEHASQARQESR